MAAVPTKLDIDVRLVGMDAVEARVGELKRQLEGLLALQEKIERGASAPVANVTNVFHVSPESDPSRIARNVAATMADTTRFPSKDAAKPKPGFYWVRDPTRLEFVPFVAELYEATGRWYVPGQDGGVLFECLKILSPRLDAPPPR